MVEMDFLTHLYLLGLDLVSTPPLLIYPVHKKGDKQDRNNYREITLLNVACKVFSNCILTRIKEKAEQTTGEYQGGFRPGKSTTDQIFVIRQLYQKIGNLIKRYIRYSLTSKKHTTVFIERVS